jgi:hypothetical protein
MDSKDKPPFRESEAPASSQGHPGNLSLIACMFIRDRVKAKEYTLTDGPYIKNTHDRKGPKQSQ